MAGLGDALSTANSGLQTTQRGLATVGNNIANVDTPGYTRQRPVLETRGPTVDTTGAIGNGVDQISVERILDKFVARRLVSETSRLSELDTRASIYTEVENIVNDQTSGGVDTALREFYGSLESLASSATPGQPGERSEALGNAQDLVDTVNRFDAQLRGLQREVDRAITGALPAINDLTRNIAELNVEIVRAETQAPANDLRDRQEQLILDLAERVEITTRVDESGMTSIRIKGGAPLVDGDLVNELVAAVVPSSANPFDATFSQIYYTSSGGTFDVTAQIRGGELGGLIESRDSVIAGAIRDLDTLAYTVADSFNERHSAGYGLADDVQRDFFVGLPDGDSTDDFARSFAIAADVDPGQGGSLDNIAVGATSTGPGQGAAANDTGIVDPANPANNAGAKWFKELQRDDVVNYISGDVAGSPTGGTLSVTEAFAEFGATIGQDSASTGRQLAQQESVLGSLQDRRDSVSAVSIDEEVSDLVRLQTNFQANARVITTVRTLFQALLDAF
ncbi:MAG: flagellar hook-associated protein FlgK [Myxococcota bacterium]